MKPHSTNFVLINQAGRFLYHDNRGTTDNIDSARAYKTYRSAAKRCTDTNFKYIRVDEVNKDGSGIV